VSPVCINAHTVRVSSAETPPGTGLWESATLSGSRYPLVLSESEATPVLTWINPQSPITRTRSLSPSVSSLSRPSGTASPAGLVVLEIKAFPFTRLLAHKTKHFNKIPHTRVLFWSWWKVRQTQPRCQPTGLPTFRIGIWLRSAHRSRLLNGFGRPWAPSHRLPSHLLFENLPHAAGAKLASFFHLPSVAGGRTNSKQPLIPKGQPASGFVFSAAFRGMAIRSATSSNLGLAQPSVLMCNLIVAIVSEGLMPRAASRLIFLGAARSRSEMILRALSRPCRTGRVFRGRFWLLRE
jgi:hypothetical protein